MHRTTGDNYALDANGNRVFTEGPPPTTVDAGILNSIQEEIANAIEASGQTLAEGPGSDTMGQLAIAIQKVAAYDSIVYSQETFNAVWERTAANAYKLRDDIGSIYFKAYPGGYNMSGPSSPLSGGDTWGAFSTNNCTFVMCDGGNFFQMGDTPSYWSIATSNTVVYNMDVRGVGAVAAAITKSIYIGAGVENCSLLFSSVSNRYSSAEHNVIYDAEKKSVVYGSGISGMNSSGNVSFRGFYSIKKAIGCTIRDSAFDSTGVFIAFASCVEIVGCKVLSINTAGYFYGFSTTEQISSVSIVSCTSALAFVGFYFSNQCSSALVTSCTSTSGDCTGFSNCLNISASSIDTLLASAENTYGFYVCRTIAGSDSRSITATSKSAYGFYDCTELSSCRAYTIETSINNASYKAVGFQDCDQLSACTADTIAASAANAYAYGFHTCTHMSSSCHATNVTSITASRDIDFYACSSAPFKSPNSDNITYTAYGSGTTTMTTWTAPKDGHIYGFFYNSNATGGPICYVKEGGYATNQTDADLLVHAYGTNISAGGSFAMPVKAGLTYYFNKSNNTAIYLTLRFMPYGTTT